MRALGKKSIAVLLIISVIMQFSGCRFWGDIDNVSNTPEPQGQTVEENETENAITIGVVELDTYNPLTTKSVTMQNMLGFIFEPLFALDSSQNVTGILAEDYEISPDGKSIVISLRQNVIWHDGTTFSSNDVVYTMKAILNNDTRYADLLKNVVSIKPTDTNTVTVVFSRSIPNPAALMSFPVIKSGSMSEKFKAIGTGPFYLDYDRLTAFNAYYGTKPKLDYINIKSIPDNDKFISLFNASVIDIADSSMLDMTEYTPRSNASVNSYVTNEMIFVGFNTNDDVFKHPEARRSVYEVIDRQNVVSHIYFSRAEVAHHPINPSNRFYPDSPESMHSDLGAAEKELKAGKWEKDKRGVYFRSDNAGATYFGVEILVNSNDKERIKIAADISDKMSEAGMKNTVIVCSETEFLNRIEAGYYDMFVGKISLMPDNDLTDLISANNVLGYYDEETDIFLAQLGTLTNETDRKEIYANFFEHIKEECPIAVVCFLKDSIISSAKIKSGIEPSVSGTVLRTENWSVK